MRIAALFLLRNTYVKSSWVVGGFRGLKTIADFAKFEIELRA